MYFEYLRWVIFICNKIILILWNEFDINMVMLGYLYLYVFVFLGVWFVIYVSIRERDIIFFLKIFIFYEFNKVVF